MAESQPAGQAEGQEEVHRQQEQGQVTWETARLFRAGMRKAKVQRELNVARAIKNNKGVYRCVSMERKGQSRCDTIGRLVTMDEKGKATSLSSSLEWWNQGQGLGEQSPSHCKGKSSL